MKHFIFSTSGLFDIFICKRSCDGFYSDFDCSNKSPKLLIVARYQNIYIYILPPIKIRILKLFLLFLHVWE